VDQADPKLPEETPKDLPEEVDTYIRESLYAEHDSVFHR
jgi:hypothetical protein